MNNSTYIEVYDRIANSLLNNNLNFFIGAGFSYYFGYPSWKELLNNIIDEVDIRGKLMETSLFPFIHDNSISDKDKVNNIILNNLLGVDYLRLAGYIDILVPDSIHLFVIKAIQKAKTLRKNNLNTQQFVKFFENFGEYIDDIITTNYDDNIEYCFKNEISVVSRDKKSLASIKGKQRLYKIHGCVNSTAEDFLVELGFDKYSDNIVITEKDYNNFKSSNLYLFYKVFSLFTEKKTLFIGYSINDPNIRALLNDVIEEAGSDFKPELFWVTRDYLSDLDKDYLKKNFELTIIEGVELEDFFSDFQERIVENRNIRELNEKELSDFVKKFLDNSDDVAYRKNMLLKSIDDKLEALKQIYTELITTKKSKYLEVLLDLVISDKSIEEKFELQLSNVISSDKTIIYAFVEELVKKQDYIDLIYRRGLHKHFISNVISFAGKSHEFGFYAKSITMLLETYRIFKQFIPEFEESFVNELVYNIKNSTDDDEHNRYKGYDYRGLYEVEKNIRYLDAEVLNKILEKFSNEFINLFSVRQLIYIIKFSGLVPKEKENKVVEKIVYPLVKIELFDYMLRYVDRLCRKYSDYIVLYNDSYEVLFDTFKFDVSIDNLNNIIVETIKNDDCVFKLVASLNYSDGRFGSITIKTNETECFETSIYNYDVKDIQKKLKEIIDKLIIEEYKLDTI